MKTIFTILIFLSCITIQASSSTILLLKGSSSCARSIDICNVLREKHQWAVVNDDEELFVQANQHWTKYFPEEMSHLNRAIDPHNLWHAVMYKQISFKHMSTPKEQLRAMQASEFIRSNWGASEHYKSFWISLSQHLATTIKARATNNTPVAVIQWALNGPDREELDSHKEYNIHDGLVYCSLPTLITRLKEQNKKAFEGSDYRSIRFFSHIWADYFGHCKLVSLNAHTEKNAIARLLKEQAEEALITIETALFSSEQTSDQVRSLAKGDMNKEKFEIAKQSLLEQFKEHAELAVVPKNAYDIILDTNTHTPEQCAEDIMAYIKQGK